MPTLAQGVYYSRGKNHLDLGEQLEPDAFGCCCSTLGAGGGHKHTLGAPHREEAGGCKRRYQPQCQHFTPQPSAKAVAQLNTNLTPRIFPGTI